jgi:hypothetical protein
MKEQPSGLGKVLGITGFICGLAFGWNATQNGWAALITGVIFWVMGVAVGNLITKVLIVLIYIALVFGSAYIRHQIIHSISGHSSAIKNIQGNEISRDFIAREISVRNASISDSKKNKNFKGEKLCL